MTDPVAYGGDLCVADTHAGQDAPTAPVDVTQGLKGSVQYEQWLTDVTISFGEMARGGAESAASGPTRDSPLPGHSCRGGWGGTGSIFTAATRRDLGYGDLRDILKGLDTIEASYPIEKSREGLLGWSCGGCMTMFAVTQTQRFHAAVAGARIADYSSFYGETFFITFTLSLFGGTPYEDPAIYTRLSAITFIKQAKTPTPVLVGERDQGSTPEQSLEFWRGLRTVGTPTQLVVCPGEGHVFSRKNSVDTLQRSAEWFTKYMPAVESGKPAQSKAASESFR